jgi:hypothetical protein
MSKRRRSGSARRVAEAKFWEGSEPGGVVTTVPPIKPTPEPGALVRSLGPPPLAVDAALAERHLTAV